MATELPDGLHHTRTTEVFHDLTTPPGLLRTHRLAAGVWGRIVVHAGSMLLRFEDGDREEHALESGGSAVIPPERPHHVELGPGAEFAIEFHRP